MCFFLFFHFSLIFSLGIVARISTKLMFIKLFGEIYDDINKWGEDTRILINETWV